MQTVPESYFLVLAIFTAVTAVAVLIQAGVLLGMFLFMRKSMTKMQTLADEMKEKALPAIVSARILIEDLTPKLKIAAANLTEVSHTVRTESKHVSETVDVLLSKTNAQLNRVDGMLSATLDAVDHATRVVETAVNVPVRRVSGILNGVRAGVGVLVGKRGHSAHSSMNGAEHSAEESADFAADSAATSSDPMRAERVAEQKRSAG
ncbi:MAG TPA: hypothetical protein VFW25_04430 [Silvibacterium sp.]|nr:hypothetical protein [Silvibacterium sp.]